MSNPELSEMQIPNIGTLFLNYFDKNYYADFLASHTPQQLTESNKGDAAFRKGVYLSRVQEEKGILYFHLLRCSSNLIGPTEGFTSSDEEIIARLNKTAKELYPDAAEINHVLAQVYYNQQIGNKQRTAKIMAHSDKTEDMPKNAVMAFCTFYDPVALADKKYHLVNGELYYKNASALTKLRFVRKSDGQITDVKLWPNSVLFIDLNTNRDFTHEIVPPQLSSADISTRLGYVARCSKQLARFKEQTEIFDNHRREPASREAQQDKWLLLRQPTNEDIRWLKEQYLIENAQAVTPDYVILKGQTELDFSLNQGDYLKPIKK